jgi:hypothetical protein
MGVWMIWDGDGDGDCVCPGVHMCYDIFFIVIRFSYHSLISGTDSVTLID